MKLGKKKDADASVDEKPAKKAVKKEKNSSSGPKLKKLNSVAVSQSLVVVLAGGDCRCLASFSGGSAVGKGTLRVIESSGSGCRRPSTEPVF